MNLKDFLAKRDNPPELFWSVVIEDASTQSGIWHIDEETSVVDGIGSPASYFTSEDLISSVDATLSSAMQKLPDDSLEPKKTVFGVPSSWVSGGEIKDEHIANIKNVCDELSLNAVGFVVLGEAVAHLYKSEEGVPLSAIVVGINKNSLEVSVFKLGNLAGSATVARSVNFIDDVIEGLSRFEGASPLPSRFVIYDGKEGELDAAKDEIMKASWDDNEKVKFLHTPKAEVLTSDRKILAVSLAGASEMGGNVLKVLKREMTEITPDVENIEPVDESESLKDIGFAVNEDVAQVNRTDEAVSDPLVSPIHKPKNVFHNMKLPSLHMPKLPKFNFAVAPLGLVFVGILILIAILFYFVPKADVSIAVVPKTFENKFEITFDEDNSKILETSNEGSKTKPASGKKVVGEKAKGSVEIANGNASAIKLTAGTVLTSSSGLKFTTLKEASISGQLLPGSPGTAQIDVAASDIGSSYNLGKGEIFSVGNYAKNLVAATSQSDFSGGSSREILAVSKDDRDSLLKDLKNELIDNAQSDLENEVDNESVLVSDYSEISVENEDYDHKVGDEADNVKLDLEVKIKLLSVDKTKLYEFTKQKLSDTAPTGFVLRSDQINYTFDFKKQDNNKYLFDVSVKANYLPSVNVDDIKKQISGKTIDASKNYLKTMPGFRSAQIVFNSNIFARLGIMPFVSNNITVQIGAEK